MAQRSASLETVRRLDLHEDVAAAHAAGRRWRHVTRWVGLGLFLFGVMLLVWVFWQALNGFQQFGSENYLTSRLGQVAGAKPESQVQTLVLLFVTEFLRVLYMLVLGLVASAIASRGISFFSSSQSIIDEAVVAEADAAEAEAEAAETNLARLNEESTRTQVAQ